MTSPFPAGLTTAKRNLWLQWYGSTTRCSCIAAASGRLDPSDSKHSWQSAQGEAPVRQQRKRIWIDPFQTYLIFRIGFYLILYQIASWAFVVIEQGSTQALEGLGGELPARFSVYFAAIGIVILSGLAIYDTIKFAHRLVGPIYRFRKTLQAIAAGEEVSLINLRQGDFLLDMKDDFNEMLKALEQRGALVLKSPEAKQNAEKPVAV
jgi:hypothetical protein